jgi:hypothetical protein
LASASAARARRVIGGNKLLLRAKYRPRGNRDAYKKNILEQRKSEEIIQNYPLQPILKSPKHDDS